MRTTVRKATENIKDPCLRNFMKLIINNEYNQHHTNGGLAELIEEGFTWSSTKEGSRFWSGVLNDLKQKKESKALDRLVFEYYGFKYEKGSKLISDKAECYYFSNPDDEGDVLILDKSILTVVGLFLHEAGVYQICQKGNRLYYFKEDVVNTFRPFAITKKVEVKVQEEESLAFLITE